MHMHKCVSECLFACRIITIPHPSVHVIMLVHMCACVGVHMHGMISIACMRAYAGVHMHVRLRCTAFHHSCPCFCSPPLLCAHAHVCVCACAFMCLLEHVCVCACTFERAWTRASAIMHVCLCVARICVGCVPVVFPSQRLS